VVESLPVVLPAAAQKLFQAVTDELIRYDNDPHHACHFQKRMQIDRRGCKCTEVGANGTG